MAKGYERKGDHHIMRFCVNDTGNESLINLLTELDRYWYAARYWYRVKRYKNHVTVSYGKIKRS